MPHLPCIRSLRRRPHQGQSRQRIKQRPHALGPGAAARNYYHRCSRGSFPLSISNCHGLLVLAYVAKAAVDMLTYQAGNNIFEKWGAWFDARTSWLNKYKPSSWPSAPVPRFLGSTTVFAWLTDFWHAADSVYLTSYLLGGMLLGAWLGASGAWPWVLAVALVKAGGGGVFQGCYRWFRIK